MSPRTSELDADLASDEAVGETARDVTETVTTDGGGTVDELADQLGNHTAKYTVVRLGPRQFKSRDGISLRASPAVFSVHRYCGYGVGKRHHAVSVPARDPGDRHSRATETG